MDWMTIDALAEKVELSQYRITQAARTGGEVAGLKFEADKTVKPPLFRVVGEASPPIEVKAVPPKKNDPITQSLLDDILKKVDRVALSDAGVELDSIVEWLGTITAPAALRKLWDIPGIGPVGARRILAHAQSLGWVAATQVPEMPFEIPEEPSTIIDEHGDDVTPVEVVITGQGEVDAEVIEFLPSKEKEDPISIPSFTKRASLPHAKRHHPMCPGCVFEGQAEHGSDLWMSLRAKGIGSSDAGAVLGLSPFATNVDVWATKVGVETPNKPWMEPYSWFGNWFEPYIIFRLQKDGVEIVPGTELGTLRSVTWPWAMANLDGLDEQYGFIEEIKTTSEKWDKVPAYYYAQVQHQMAVCNVDAARIRQFICPIPRSVIRPLLEAARALATFPAEGDRLVKDWLWTVGEMVTWVVEYDPEFTEQLMEREADLMKFVETGEEPPLFEPDGSVDLTDVGKLSAALTAYADVARRVSKEDIKAADKLKKEARDILTEVLALRGETPKRVVCGPHNATWVVKHGNGYWQIRGGNDGIDI